VAERLEDFNFRASRGRPGYDWDSWLDGGIWRLTKEIDFWVRPDSFRNQAASAAIKRGGRVRTRIEKDTVVLQFYRKTG
jgi:hypothetical protein